MSYEDDREYRRKQALSSASSDATISTLLVLLVVTPVRFLAVNLPAAGLAWIGTYYLSGPLFRMFEHTAARGISLVVCFMFLTFIVWMLLTTCYKASGRLPWALGVLIKGIILVYVFGSYGTIAFLLARAAAPNTPIFYWIVGILAGLAGGGYYLNKIMHDPTAGSGQKEMKESLDKIEAEHQRKVAEINRNS